MSARNTWRLWADTGGTFTDCVAVDPAGGTHRAKVLSTGALRGEVVERLDDRRLRIDAAWLPLAGALRSARFRSFGEHADETRLERIDPESGELTLRKDAGATPGVEPGALVEIVTDEPAPVLAARLLTATPLGSPLPPIEMRLATTRGTNALLERTTAPTAFFVTEGFGDLLEIGDQRRPDLFALCIRKSTPYCDTIVETPERLAADGSVVRPLDDNELARRAGEALNAGFRVAAVALGHSWLNPEHEQRLGRLLRDLGFEHISLSSDLAPRIGLLTRAQTTVVNAALSPVLGEYLDEIGVAASTGRLHVMTSAGGLVAAENFRPADGLLSGPAGGVVGAADAAQRSGFDKAIIFDMGGTSTDVARFDGDYEYAFEHHVGDARLAAPALAIESVAAGGGSICGFDGERPIVGPRSAGADPGPACYGAGGPLTVTDVNILLGRLDPARFQTPINHERAEQRFNELVRDRAMDATDEDRDALLQGFLDIADERMAEAIRRISVRKGYDPSEYALTAFGGAGPQHAAAVAEALGVATVIIPADASLLSAHGLGAASVERFAEQQLLRSLENNADAIDAALDELERRARTALREEGIEEDATVRTRRIVNMRFAGQDQSVQVEASRAEKLREDFERRYRQIFGYLPSDRDIEVESARVFARSAAPEASPSAEPTTPHDAEPASWTTAFFTGRRRRIAVYERNSLRPGARFVGPAIVAEENTATVVNAEWSGEIDAAGAVVLRRVARLSEPHEQGGEDEQHIPVVRPERSSSFPPINRPAQPRAVRLELLAHRLNATAEQMGEMLRRTALSVNVKERRDYSCGVLDAQGRLVASAPHLPVHLGALGACARRLLETVDMNPGDVIVTNHPAFGGSHLPDVTTVAPVFDDSGENLLGYVATRAHHAEIGGARPGSMPPDAKNLAEEGVVIPPTRLFEKGESRWDAMRGLLESGPFPSRAVADNLADLRAAVAAGRTGAEALRAMVDRAGADETRDAMDTVLRRAADRVRDALRAIGRGDLSAEEYLDDGSAIRVRIDSDADPPVIDFAGTCGAHSGNLNAPLAVTRSAVAYVLRLLVNEPMPLNDGLLAPVDVCVPTGCMLNPPFDEDAADAPAVAGGNVETSQRIVDTLIKALNLSAAGQGTMNNVLFGADRFGYYETIGGGAGATADCPGASAVHTHMTNTAITDMEIFERRYPARLERFAIRRGSGGRGRFPGGDGAEREIRFLEPAQLSVLAQRRRSEPFGAEGGEPGKPGAQRVIRASGEIEQLDSIAGADLNAGDRLVIETPGGGAWGTP